MHLSQSALLIVNVPVSEHVITIIICLSPPSSEADPRGTDYWPSDAHLVPGVVVLVYDLHHRLPDPPHGLYHLGHQDVIRARENETVESQASGEILKYPIVVNPKVRVSGYPQLDSLILRPEPEQSQPTERGDADTDQDEVNWLPGNGFSVLEEKSF